TTWIDWDGDGKSDLCRETCVNDSGGSCKPWDHWNNEILCALSTGTGIDDRVIGPPLPAGEEGRPGERWFVDWNGDGRGDFCRATVDSASQLPVIKCALSTGTGYTDGIVAVLTDSTGGSNFADALGVPATRAMVDWNGDGRTDFCRILA